MRFHPHIAGLEDVTCTRAPRVIAASTLLASMAVAQSAKDIRGPSPLVAVVPVFGKGALDVSPRIGHLHITVDDAPWHFVDASGETVILVGLAPGPHKVLFELADPTHKVITSETVEFMLLVRASHTP